MPVMEDLHTEINKLVAQLVSDISALARQAALETLSTVLGGDRASPEARRIAPTITRQGAKRDASDIDQAMEKILAFIKENPGTRIEEANKALGTATKYLALPLKKLIAAGVVRTEGQRRGMQYFPGSGERPAPRAAKKKASKRRAKKK